MCFSLLQIGYRVLINSWWLTVRIFFFYLDTGLVAKIEKNLTDHTEFLNYKEEMNKWLAIATDTLDSCAGIGDEGETRQKLQNITVSTNISPFGWHKTYFIESLSFVFCKELVQPPTRRQAIVEYSSRSIYQSHTPNTRR